MVRSNITPTILRIPKQRHISKEILTHLRLGPRTRLCQLQEWAVQGVYPFCFLGQYRSPRGSPPVLAEYTTYPDTQNKLAEFLRESSGDVRLPKHIIILDTEQGREVYLGPDMTRPPASFSYTETADYYVLTGGQSSSGHSTPLHAALSLISPPLTPGRDGMGMLILIFRCDSISTRTSGCKSVYKLHF